MPEPTHSVDTHCGMRSGALSLALAVLAGLLACSTACAVPLPTSGEKVTVSLPDYGAELRAFNAPVEHPVSWWPHVINAGWGEGRGGPERTGGWIDKHWQLIDYLDRSADYTANDWLRFRGIWYEVYGSNEYQESIHFWEPGARKLLWDNGIARDYKGDRALSADYNTSVAWWKERIGWDAYITCNNAPRWSAIIDHDLLTSPLLGFATSQDNIGGPTSRIGYGSHGRYCDWCNAKFRHYLTVTNRLPDFRTRYSNIRDYVQGNLMDVIRQLPPLSPWTFDLKQSQVIAKLGAPPVMSEYLKFLYLSHLHNFMRYYQDLKRVAAGLGREFDVHGNQGGSAIGSNPYQVALADFVDTVWFESSGISAYDMFRWHWYNADGAFRYVMGRAMTRGRKPFMSMTAFGKRTPHIVEHELAEQCAGGGTLFISQLGFDKQPELQRIMTDYYQFRHAHRALYAPHSSQPYVRVALAYSVPTLLYYSYMYAVSPPLTALCGMARALEENHVPYDVVILNHPEIHQDRDSVDDLKQYSLIVVPALECLSQAQVDRLTAYLKAGGTLGVIGRCGVKDENNLPREQSVVEAWRQAGKVIEILPGRDFLPPRVQESAQTREQTQAVMAALGPPLRSEPIIDGSLPPRLWLKSWRHEGAVLSLHFVNYHCDFEAGTIAPTAPARVTIALPAGTSAEEARWLVPGQPDQALPFELQGHRVSLTLPGVQVYGVLVVGPRNVEGLRSSHLQGQAMLARAEMAAGGEWGDLKHDHAALTRRAASLTPATSSAQEAEAFAAEATRLLAAVCTRRQSGYLGNLTQAVDATHAARAFDCGAPNPAKPWLSAMPATGYTSERGFGWLPNTDASDPTPEELYYAGAHQYGQGFLGPEPAAVSLMFWPYREAAPAPLRRELGCGTPRTFRVDLPPGPYAVRVVTTTPSWTNLNFEVASMVRANGACKLLDVAQEKGGLVSREFGVTVPADGRLDLTFGGPTGWGVSALLVLPRAEPVPDDCPGGVRTWRVSPRYANPDWYPIDQVATPLDRQTGALAGSPSAQWTEVKAAGEGLPLMDLGTNREADVGDVVYAVATVQAPADGPMTLQVASSSQAQVFVNGALVGIVPNTNGVGPGDFHGPVPLRAGANTLVVKLQRFWERHWMFGAWLTPTAPR